MCRQSGSFFFKFIFFYFFPRRFASCLFVRFLVGLMTPAFSFFTRKKNMNWVMNISCSRLIDFYFDLFAFVVAILDFKTKKNGLQSLNGSRAENHSSLPQQASHSENKDKIKGLSRSRLRQP